MGRIVNDINRATIEEGASDRLIKKHDLHNISRSFGIDREGRYHKDDATSSLMALQALKAKYNLPHCLKYRIHCDDFFINESGECHPSTSINTAIANKKKPVLAKHPMAQSFVALATPYQIKKLLQHAPNTTIGVDSTHLVTMYGHYLTTVMVQDERREGQVVAFCLSSNKDKKTYTEFFRGLRDITGPIKCDYFMTDGDRTIYASWKDVMGPAVQPRLCWWHVLRCWGKKTHDLGFSPEATTALFIDLRSLHEKSDRIT